MKKIREKIFVFLRDPATQTIIAIVTLIATIAWGAVTGWLGNALNWLMQNRTIPNWLVIFGIVAIISVSILCKKKSLQRPATKLAQSRAVNPNKDIDTYTTQPKAKDIIDELLQMSPYQKGVVQDSYKGQKIKWRLKFNDIVDIENDIAWIQLCVADSAANIYAHAEIKKYPKIKTIKRDEIIFIEGEIEKLTDYATIWLTNTSIKFEGET